MVRQAGFHWKKEARTATAVRRIYLGSCDILGIIGPRAKSAHIVRIVQEEFDQEIEATRGRMEHETNSGANLLNFLYQRFQGLEGCCLKRKFALSYWSAACVHGNSTKPVRKSGKGDGFFYVVVFIDHAYLN